MDDDIVFLGRTPYNAGRMLKSTANMTAGAARQRPVMGLALHVEKNGDSGAHVLIFYKADSMVVHIGRRSGGDGSLLLAQQNQDPATATFRCAVVSRKHAKIAFSDSGHVYLIDLNSHHGTYVRRPLEKFSKMIKPETPTILSDGDIITFGKSVGKGIECVRPVVGKVELLFGDSKPAILPGLADTLFPAVDSNSMSMSILGEDVIPFIVPSQPQTPGSPASSSSEHAPKSSSGRYGVHTTSASSSASSSSSSDADESPNTSGGNLNEAFDPSGIYSDIEEISPPPEFCGEIKALESSVSQGSAGLSKSTNDGDNSANVDVNPSITDPNSNNDNKSSHSFAFNVLRRFLPPAPSSLHDRRLTPFPQPSRKLPSVSKIVERPLAHMTSLFWGPESETSPFHEPFGPSASMPSTPLRTDCRSPLGRGLRLAWRWDGEAGRNRYHHEAYSPTGDLFSPSILREEEEMEESDEDDRENRARKEKERSNSPMDLSSPSPSAEVIVSRSLSIPPPSLTAPPLLAQLQPISSIISGEQAQEHNSPRSPDPLSSLSAEGSKEHDHQEVLILPSQALYSDAASTDGPTSSSSTTMTAVQFKEIKDVLEGLKQEVSKLQTHRRKYKVRFNSNVHVMSSKMVEWDERIGKLEENTVRDTSSSLADSSSSSAVAKDTTLTDYIDDKFTLLDGRINGFSARLDGIDSQFAKVDEKLASMEDKLTSVDEKLFGTDEKMLNIDETMDSFSDRLDELNAECAHLANQLEIEKSERERLGEEGGDLEERASEVEWRLDVIEGNGKEYLGPETETQKTKEELAELKIVVEELKAFKDVTETGLRDEIAKMKAKHQEDMKMVWGEVERVRSLYEKQQNSFGGNTGKVRFPTANECRSKADNSIIVNLQTPVQTSLKRKRDDTDENADVNLENSLGDSSYIDEIRLLAERSFDVTEAMDVDDNGHLSKSSDDGPSFNLALTDSYLRCGPEVQGHERPRKRARKIASVVAQTATAVTIGAVVTWGALAFS